MSSWRGLTLYSHQQVCRRMESFFSSALRGTRAGIVMRRKWAAATGTRMKNRYAVQLRGVMLNIQHISPEKNTTTKTWQAKLPVYTVSGSWKSFHGLETLRPQTPLPFAIIELHRYYCSFSVDVLVIDFIWTAETKGLQCIVNCDVDGCIS